MLNLSELDEIEGTLKNNLQQFEQFYVTVAGIDNATQANNQIVAPKFMKIFMTNSYQTLHYLLCFLSDSEIMSIAACCRAAYRLVYSPLGFRLMRQLRPIRYTEGKESSSTDDEIPHFSQATVEQLCSDRNLESADEDDKMAILLTMRTNILATKQKIRELDLMIQAYDMKSDKLLTKIMYIGGQREEECRKINTVQEDIEKLRELLKATQGHHESLREEQERLLMGRQQRMLLLSEERTKLQRQKQLLIKKIKSQQKEKEEGMVYARQVSRVLRRLDDITSKAGSSKEAKAKEKERGEKDKAES